MLPPLYEHVARILAVLGCVLAGTRPASSQTISALTPLAVTFGSPLTSEFVVASETAPAVPAGRVVAPPSLTLAALHVSFGALEVMDVFSTMRGLNAGLTEANPLMPGLARRPGAMAAVKAGAGTMTILLTRRMARKNRLAAIVTMAALNGAYAVIVARNLVAVGR